MTPGSPQAAILCGGLGTRLRSALPDRPKSLAEVGGRAFIDILLGHLAAAAVPRVVLCAGVGAEALAAHVEARDFGLEVVIAREPTPLGTGGALAAALPLLHSDPVLVLNGDSWVTGLVLEAFCAFQRRRAAAVAVVVVPAGGRADTGQIQLAGDGSGPVRALAEKQALAAGYDSAGIYLLGRHRLEGIPRDRPVSLEREMLPAWLADGIDAFVHPGPLIDIGTPERWSDARLHPERLL